MHAMTLPRIDYHKIGHALASTHLIAQTRGGASFNALIRWLFYLTALSVSELTKEVEL